MNCLAEIETDEKRAVFRQVRCLPPAPALPTRTEISARLDVIAYPILRGSISKATSRSLTDEPRIYNRALSPAEVKQLYQLGSVIIRP